MVAPAEEIPPAFASVCAQTLVLFRRHLKLTLREPLLYTGRMAILACTSVIFCLVYIQTRSLRQDQVLKI